MADFDIIVDGDAQASAEASAAAAVTSATNAATSAASAATSATNAATSAAGVQEILQSDKTYTTDIAQLSLEESTGYGVISGFNASNIGYNFTVAAGIAHMPNGVRYNVGETLVTIDQADATNPRIDVVYLSNAGVVTYVAGVAANHPIPPVTTNGIHLYYIKVPVNSSEISIVDKKESKSANKYVDSFYLSVFFDNLTSGDNTSTRIVKFYLSRDGINFTQFNKSVKIGDNYNVGDPSIAYYNGKFYLATSNQDSSAYDCRMFISDDLINWVDYYPSLGVYTSTTWGYCNRWAPDLFFDDDGTLYCVIAADSDALGAFDIYLCKCTDLNTLTFGEPTKLTLWDGTDTTNLSTNRSHIDATIRKVDNTYYMAVKNEPAMTIEIFTSTNILSGWKKITSTVFNDHAEGPCIEYVNGRWKLWADRYASASNYGRGNYAYCESNDLITFTNYKMLKHDNVTNFGQIRHGTILWCDDDKMKNTISKVSDFAITYQEGAPRDAGGTYNYLPFANSVTPTVGSTGNVLEVLNVEPNSQFLVSETAGLEIDNIVNTYGVKKTAFRFTNDYSKYLKIVASGGNAINFIATPIRNKVYVFEGRDDGALFPTNNNIMRENLLLGNDNMSTGYAWLFDIVITGSYKTVSTIFHLIDPLNDGYDAVYEAKVRVTSTLYSYSAKLINNLLATTRNIFMVNKGSGVYGIYTNIDYASQGLSICFMSAHQMGNVAYIQPATPGTVVSSLASLGTVYTLI